MADHFQNYSAKQPAGGSGSRQELLLDDILLPPAPAVCA
jgi:hypothetical protein